MGTDSHTTMIDGLGVAGCGVLPQKKKLQVPDVEFSKRRDIYGAWEQYLGLEHDDSAPKRSYAVNQEINCCFVEWMCKLRCNINKRAVVRLTEPKRKTIGERGIDCIFIGYAEHSKAYRFYVLESNDSVAVNSVIESRDAIFDEQRFTSIPRPKDMNSMSKVLVNIEDIPSTSTKTRKSTRVRKAKSFGDDFQFYLVEGSRNDIEFQYQYCLNVEEDPKTFSEAMASRDVVFWKEAIQSEMDSIMQNNTWKLVDLPLGYKCLYNKFDTHGKGVIICLYVDDMLIFGTDQDQVDETKAFLSSKFDMKDMGEADVILGIKIKRGNNGISISQSHYIEKIFEKFNFKDCSPVSTPIDPNLKLLPNKGVAVSQLEYSRAIGSLMYAMISTRPDIAYGVAKLSRFTSNPSSHHWQAMNRVFKYLKGTIDYGLTYTEFPSVIKGYSYASWITNMEDYSSTSGWVFLLGGGAISWASKKQTCITNSTMESEFVALAAAGKEAEWLRNLIYEIPLWPKPIPPMSIRCDSQATLAKAYSQVYNGKSRHLGIRHNMVRELIMHGVISVDSTVSHPSFLGDPTIPSFEGKDGNSHPGSRFMIMSDHKGNNKIIEELKALMKDKSQVWRSWLYGSTSSKEVRKFIIP
ncbi:uncharacterized protein [Glycine max]|uniref:uncharacterized protein n=1 Tax=Glycine max TaxID=3847 RepID=UPI000E21BB4F|nr:uncharacterized protein LOC112999608 [Glycine max]|eukprot:XP_025981715.1 uncharacterized protein LOC112999608 [Glycine max]